MSPDVPRANVYQILLQAWDCECLENDFFWAKERVMKSPTLSYLWVVPLKSVWCKCTVISRQGSLKAIKIKQGVSPIQYAMRTYLASSTLQQ